jgi:hypothetical protein
MFMDLDRSLVQQHNEELRREARKWHLQRMLRATRERRLGTRPQVDSRRTGTGAIEMKQERGAHMTLELSNESRVEHGSSGSELVGAAEELVWKYVALRRTRMRGIEVKGINRRAFREVVWVG